METPIQLHAEPMMPGSRNRIRFGNTTPTLGECFPDLELAYAGWNPPVISLGQVHILFPDPCGPKIPRVDFLDFVDAEHPEWTMLGIMAWHGFRLMEPEEFREELRTAGGGSGWNVSFAARLSSGDRDYVPSAEYKLSRGVIRWTRSCLEKPLVYREGFLALPSP